MDEGQQAPGRIPHTMAHMIEGTKGQLCSFIQFNPGQLFFFNNPLTAQEFSAQY